MKRCCTFVMLIILLFPAHSYSEKKEKNSNWSFFWNAFKFQDADVPKTQFEWGVLAYQTSRNYWSLMRLEPFIKLRWTILEKYLQPYIIFSLDYTNVTYELAQYQINGMAVSLNAELVSSANPTYGGGLHIFLIGWKRLNIYGYGQFQTTALNDAVMESAELKLGGTTFNLQEIMADHIDVNYNLRRYECGTISTYQFFSWFSTLLYLGYIWFDINIELNIGNDLAEQFRTLTGMNAYDLIPKRFVIDENSFFAMLGLKFRIYKRLHIALEGTVVPIEHPIYFGQVSLIIEDRK